MTNLSASLESYEAALARLEAALDRRRAENRLAAYQPYIKQAEFHQRGKEKRERLFMAGNQLGKTVAGGFEFGIHATGKYPDWWQGRVFDAPIVGWAAGVTGESTRDTVQRILLGRPGEYGTGAIPKADIIDVTPARGVPNLVDTILVRHHTGKQSIIGLKSYEKGREKWQGETLHLVWYDEEPPEDIYTEGLTRTNATAGMVFMTFTPLLGMSAVVSRFLLEESPDRCVTSMTIDDVSHYSEEQKARIISAYPEHEREARAKGIPTLGSGRVYPISEEDIAVAPFEIPPTWPVIGGMDFGYDHPFAAVKMAWDRDSDTIYVVSAYRQRQATPIIHAASIKPWGDGLPWAWPHDGLQHDKGSGVELAEQYRRQGLALLPERAQFEDGSFGLEAGVSRLLQRMQTKRLKVFKNLGEWFEEFRIYHRKEGLIVKEKDDLLSATRYAEMCIRHAKPLRPKSWAQPSTKWVV